MSGDQHNSRFLLKKEHLHLTLKYSFFAAIASGVNLGVQYVSLHVYNYYFALYFAMIMGTGAGLVVKYILDKKYIFYYEVQSKKEDAGKFIVYTAMGVITTVIFWGAELAFNAAFHFESAKYIGGALGLAVGYVTKYILDKKFVFVD